MVSLASQHLGLSAHMHVEEMSVVWMHFFRMNFYFFFQNELYGCIRQLYLTRSQDSKTCCHNYHFFKQFLWSNLCSHLPSQFVFSCIFKYYIEFQLLLTYDQLVKQVYFTLNSRCRTIIVLPPVKKECFFSLYCRKFSTLVPIKKSSEL